MLSEAMESMIQEGTITNMNQGSRVRTLLSTMTTYLGRTYRMMELDELMRVVSTSRGEFLDLIGDLLSIIREEPESATVLQDDQNIKFYTPDGSTLISHLPGGTIPAGTTITTSDASVSYTTVVDVPFSTIQTSVFVPASASVTGTDGNVGAGVLTSHSLGASGVSVTNVYSIDTGSNQETDDNYRFRIANAVKTYARANQTAVRIAALSIPGVADAFLYDYRSGVGTFDILIIPTGNKVSTSTIRRVRSAVNSVKALGVVATIREPGYVPTELAVQVDFESGVTEGEKSTIRTRVQNNILSYLGEIPIGGTFVLNEFRERVMATDEKIRDMEILCYVFRNRPQLKRNYQAQADELFIPDPSVNTPILAI